MKLTKGKISKLYTKNKQSVKKRKNSKKKTYKSKTFRKNKHSNLFNKTLKHLYGGEQGNNDNYEDIPSRNSSSLDTSVMPNNDMSANNDMTSNNDTLTDTSVMPNNDMNSNNDSSLDTSGIPNNDITNIPSDNDSSLDTSVIPDNVITNIPSNNDSSSDTSIMTNNDMTSNNDSLSDTSIMTNNDISNDIPFDNDSLTDTSVIPSDVSVESQLRNNEPLQIAVNNLGKEISDNVLKIVSKELTNNISTVTNNIQNGFNSNQFASEKMANTGGKRHKTDKFRLTNKNKHKRTKKHKK
jgi:hypothetical protein